MLTGLLPTIPKDTDYVAGGKNALIIPDRCSNWSQFLNKGELQHSVYLDSMGCASFSCNEAIEGGINYLIETYPTEFALRYQSLTEKESLLFLDFFDIENKEFNLSDRALAKLSGTTHAGNSLNVVAECARKNAVPERVWGYPRDQRDPVFDWDDFYQEIPADLVKKYSDVFFKIFKINYEFVPTDFETLKKNLKQAPIQLAGGFCPGWNTGDVKACDRINEHAFLLTSIDEKYHIRDSYAPFDKVLARDYKINCALKIAVFLSDKNLPMSNVKILKLKNKPDIVIALPVNSEEAMISYCANFGLPCPQKDGKIDWNAVRIDGEFSLNP